MVKKCGSKKVAEKVKEIMDDNLALRARGEIGVENLRQMLSRAIVRASPWPWGC